VAAVLDHLLGHGAGGGPPRASRVDPRHVDARHVVIAGHSYGALTAMALAGRRMPHLPNGTLRDGRITAAIALSPGVHPVGRGETMAAVPVPMLCATGSLDAHVDIGIEPHRVRAGVPLDNRLAVYRGLPPAHRMLLYLEGADHMTFAGEAQVDVRLFGRAPGWLAANEARHHAAVIEHTGAFLQRLRSADAAAWRAARTDFPGGYVLTGLNVPGTEGRR
jgi:predicted dienelactone hydrolase